MAARGGLAEYNRKRDFAHTAEPKGTRGKSGKTLAYLIQKHDASRLHYDFRLEWDGKLMSWAVPKGPSESTTDKRLAVHVEDHPIEYGTFEGSIPEREYGGGTVMLWDRGTWEPLEDVDAALRKGKIAFNLHGERLHGRWALVKLRARSKNDKDNWLLIKERDEFAHDGKNAVDTELTSVASGRSMAEIAAGSKVWHSNRAGNGKAQSASKSASKPAATAKRSKKNSKLPAFVDPQLASLVDAPPNGSEWLHEIKYDGYRAITAIAGGEVRIYTRKALDWTERYQPLVPALAELPCDSALLDGEIAVADSEGHTDFGALQDAMTRGGEGIGYFIFDLLELDGKDLRKRPLIERKQRLAALLEGATGALSYSDHIEGSGDEVLAHARKIALEGIISKRRDAPYVSGRTQSWLKTKCTAEQEFVIIGWRPSDKPGRPFSSLLLGLREDGELRYAGRVGSGYTGERLEDIGAQFKALERKTAPVANVPKDIARDALFLEPKLVAQVEFRGWSHDNIVRQASFKGLRADKPASEIVREHAMPKATAVKRAKAATPKSKGNGEEELAGVRVTHPDRVLFADQGVTKRDLVQYYLEVAEIMLPHVAHRPLALVRYPAGSSKPFFQKHASAGFPGEFGRIKIKDKSATREYMTIEDERGLVAAVQMGVLELHIWCSQTSTLEQPDRLVFDFDPDEGLDFAHVRDAARDMRDRLKDLGLESFPMATGGKGIHVVVPLAPKHGWDEHKNFAEALARVMADEEPDRFVANMAKAKRKGKIFIDYLRNMRGATAISPYSTRARKGAFVATPVSWQQLSRLKDARPATIADAKKLLKADPWPDYAQVKQILPLDRLAKIKR